MSKSIDLSRESVNGIVFNEDRSKILLIKRRDVPVWALPGGGIDPGETPEEAVLRELKEETSCNYSITRKVGEYTPICRLAKFTHLFECSPLRGKLQSTDETLDARYFSLNALPKHLPPPYPDWIADTVENHPSLLKKEISSITYWVMIKSFITHPILVLRFFLSKMGIPLNSGRIPNTDH